MILESELTINASIEEVWKKLLDPKCIRSCIPGCESFVSKNDREFEGVIRVKIGPIKTRFKVRVIVIEMEPPTLLISKAFGEDLFKAGQFTQRNHLGLEEIDIYQTKLTYASEFNISGKIATFGERVFKAKAKEMQDQFLASFTNYLNKKGREA